RFEAYPFSVSAGLYPNLCAQEGCLVDGCLHGLLGQSPVRSVIDVTALRTVHSNDLGCRRPECAIRLIRSNVHRSVHRRNPGWTVDARTATPRRIIPAGIPAG